jgi:hypothetical protein
LDQPAPHKRPLDGDAIIQRLAAQDVAPREPVSWHCRTAPRERVCKNFLRHKYLRAKRLRTIGQETLRNRNTTSVIYGILMTFWKR